MDADSGPGEYPAEGSRGSAQNWFWRMYLRDPENPGFRLVVGPPQKLELEAGPGVWTRILAARAQNSGDTRWLTIARQIEVTMGLKDHDAVIKAAGKSAREWLEALRQNALGQDGQVQAGAAAVAATAPDASVVTGALEEVSDLSTRAAREGIRALTKMDVLTLVLVWLVTLGAPVVQRYLPPEDQAVISNEYATVALALAITTVIWGRKR